MLRRSEPDLMLVPEPPRPGPQPDAPVDVGTAFRLHSAYVAHIGIRILGNDDEIDDLVQDVFTEAATGLHKLRGEGALKGWLGTVTVRVAVRRLRARKLRRFFRLDDAGPAADPVWPGASPEQCALITRVYGLLGELPSRQHAAWVLRRVEGEPLEEVARKCGCSLATAKRLIGAADEWIDKHVRR
jgi:RNA polymerase sigma factor (sigma-70 family)